MIIEYDDGKSEKLKDKDKDPRVTRRGRERGFYMQFENGTCEPVQIGYLRISEMKALQEIIYKALKYHQFTKNIV